MIQRNPPQDIDENENIARVVFDPMHLLKDGKLKAYFFQPPKDRNDVSVNRFDYTDENFIKGKLYNVSHSSNSFHGIAIFKAKIITAIKGLCIKHSPTKDDISHADIIFSYEGERGREIPSFIKKEIERILPMIKLFKDNDLSTPKWVGDNIDRTQL
jgi:hypothetical protein